LKETVQTTRALYKQNWKHYLNFFRKTSQPKSKF